MSDIFPMQFGCDISSKAVVWAKSRNPSATIKQNARELPFRDGQFDIVFMIKSISAVAPAMLDFILGELKRIVKRGGCILIVDFKPNERDALYPICGGLYRARSPEWSDEVFPLFTPEDFETLLGFKLLDSGELTLTSYHGNEYPGTMALLQDTSVKEPCRRDGE
jgi:SAM-dependent methyltransferase